MKKRLPIVSAALAGVLQAFAAGRTVVIREDLEDVRPYVIQVTETSAFDVRFEVAKGGRRFDPAGYAPTLWWGDESGGVSVTNATLAPGAVTFHVSPTEVPTNGTYLSQVIATKVGAVVPNRPTEEWAQGRVRVQLNPSKDALPVDWMKGSIYEVVSNAVSEAGLATTNEVESIRVELGSLSVAATNYTDSATNILATTLNDSISTLNDSIALATEDYRTSYWTYSEYGVQAAPEYDTATSRGYMVFANSRPGDADYLARFGAGGLAVHGRRNGTTSMEIDSTVTPGFEVVGYNTDYIETLGVTVFLILAPNDYAMESTEYRVYKCGLMRGQTYDSEPTRNSVRPVTSGGVAAAINSATNSLATTLNDSISTLSAAKQDKLTSAQLANIAAVPDKANASDVIRRNANTVTTAGTITDYLLNSSLVGGVRVRYSLQTLNDYTSYGYNGVTARRGNVPSDYLFGTGSNGIVRFADLTAATNNIPRPDLSAYATTNQLAAKLDKTNPGVTITPYNYFSIIGTHFEWFGIDFDNNQNPRFTFSNNNHPDYSISMPDDSGTLALKSDLPPPPVETTVANAAIPYNAGGVAFTAAASFGFTGTWPDGQAILIHGTVASGATIAANVTVVGYGSLPVDTPFQAVAWRVGERYFVNVISGL